MNKLMGIYDIYLKRKSMLYSFTFLYTYKHLLSHIIKYKQIKVF